MVRRRRVHRQGPDGHDLGVGRIGSVRPVGSSRLRRRCRRHRRGRHCRRSGRRGRPGCRGPRWRPRGRPGCRCRHRPRPSPWARPFELGLAVSAGSAVSVASGVSEGSAVSSGSSVSVGSAVPAAPGVAVSSAVRITGPGRRRGPEDRICAEGDARDQEQGDGPGPDGLDRSVGVHVLGLHPSGAWVAARGPLTSPRLSRRRKFHGRVGPARHRPVCSCPVRRRSVLARRVAVSIASGSAHMTGANRSDQAGDRPGRVRMTWRHHGVGASAGDH